jgi:integrase
MDRDNLSKMIAVAEEQAKAGYPRNLAIVYFIAETGCRVGEAVTLRIPALNLDDCEARVKGKTKGRDVDFTDRTAKAMRDWLSVRPEVDHDYVFVAKQGGKLSTGAIYNLFRRFAEKAGVKGRFNPHAIRHLVGQYWTDKANLELARQKLGHEDISTTALFYAHQDRARGKEATERLSLITGTGG